VVSVDNAGVGDNDNDDDDNNNDDDDDDLGAIIGKTENDGAGVSGAVGSNNQGGSKKLDNAGSFEDEQLLVKKFDKVATKEIDTTNSKDTDIDSDDDDDNEDNDLDSAVDAEANKKVQMVALKDGDGDNGRNMTASAGSEHGTVSLGANAFDVESFINEDPNDLLNMNHDEYDDNDVETTEQEKKKKKKRKLKLKKQMKKIKKKVGGKRKSKDNATIGTSDDELYDSDGDMISSYDDDYLDSDSSESEGGSDDDDLDPVL